MITENTMHPCSTVWLPSDDDYTADDQEIYALFRRVITPEEWNDSTGTKAQIDIAASMEYRLWVNGRFIGVGPAISDHRRTYFDRHTVSVNPGTAWVVAVQVYHPGCSLEDFHGFAPYMALNVCGDGERGDGAPIVTDERWRCVRAPQWMCRSIRQSFQLAMVEEIDLRNEPIGWSDCSFDDHKWRGAVICVPSPPSPYAVPILSDLPPIRERVVPARELAVAAVVEEETHSHRLCRKELSTPAEQVQSENLFRALSAEELKVGCRSNDYTGASTATAQGIFPMVASPPSDCSVTVVVDMGEMMMGCPRFVVDSDTDGAVCDLSVGEYIRDHRVIAHRRITPGQSTRLTDRVVLRAGENRWQRRDYNGFRFVQLTFRNVHGSLTIHHIGTAERGYQFTEAAWESSDAELDRIFTVSARTHRTAVHWGYCGSSWREHAQWNDLPWVYNNCVIFGDAAVLNYFFHQITLSQDESGRMMCPYPGAQAIELPEQTLWLAEELVWRRRYFGRWDGESEVVARLERAFQWYTRHCSNNFLIEITDEWEHLWLVMDWGYPYATYNSNTFIPGLDRQRDQSTHGARHSPGAAATVNILWWHFVINLAALTGDRSYKEHAAQIRKAIDERFYHEESRYYGEVDSIRPSHYACAEAIRTGMADPERWNALWKHAVSADGRVGRSSPWYTSSFLEAYGRTGRCREAIAAMKRLWGDMAERGATTFWEQWDMEEPDVHPLPGYTSEMWAHTIAYASGPGPFMIRYLLGLQPLEDGFTRAALVPRIDLLTHLRCTVPTRHGEISVRWLQSLRSKTVEIYVRSSIPIELTLLGAETVHKIKPRVTFWCSTSLPVFLNT